MKLKKYNELLKLDESVVEAPSISNMKNYLSSMEKGIESKLFFMDKIIPDCIVDFGCANGHLIETIYRIKPNIKLIGYDIDTRMINLLKKKRTDVFYTSDWNKVKEIAKYFESPALILSSVIHEVYSYGSSKDIRTFWNEQVFTNLFKYIVIRDMVPSIQYRKFSPIYVNQIRAKSDPKLLKSFEDHWSIQLE